MSKGFHAVIFRFFVFLLSLQMPQAFAAEGDIQFVSIAEYTRGMSPAETQLVRKIMNHKISIVDIEGSSLDGWKTFFESLSERFAGALLKWGDHSASYRINLVASDQKSAFIVKHSPPGRSYYTGHIFITIPFVLDLIEKQGWKLDQLGVEAFDKIVKGLIGIIGHEVMHPKQDELVKFEWMSAFNRHGNSSQADEMTTDAMVPQVLFDAKLPTDSLLTGLQLIVPTPESGSYVARSIKALVSTHPEDEARILAQEGAVSFVRMTKGTNEVVPLNLNLPQMIEELKRLSGGNEITNRVKGDKRAGLKKSGSDSVDLIQSAQRKILASTDVGGWPNRVGEDILIDHFKALIEILPENETEIDNEIYDAYVDLIRSVFAVVSGGRNDSLALLFSSNRQLLVRPLRELQKILNSHQMFTGKRMHQIIWDEINTNNWDAFGDLTETGGLERFAILFPGARVEEIYLYFLSKIEEDFSKETHFEEHFTRLIEMHSGVVASRCSEEIEIEILKRIQSLIETSTSENLSNADQDLMFYSWSQGWGQEEFPLYRIQSGENGEINTALMNAYDGIIVALLSHPKHLLAFQSHTRSIFLKRNSFLGKVFNSVASRKNYFKPFIASNTGSENDANLDTGAVYERLFDIYENKEWRSLFEEAQAHVLKPGNQIEKVNLAKQVAFALSQTTLFAELPISESEIIRFFKIALPDLFQSNSMNEISENTFQFLIELKNSMKEKHRSVIELTFLKILKGFSSEKTISEIFKENFSKFKVWEDFFGRNTNGMIATVEEAVASGILSQDEGDDWLIHILTEELQVNRIYMQLSADKKTVFSIYHLLRRRMSFREAMAFLAEAFHLLDVNTDDIPPGKNYEEQQKKEEFQKILDTEVEIHPDYSRHIGYLFPILIRDLKESLKINSKASRVRVTSEMLVEILSFIEAAFDPDNRGVLPEHRGLLRYDGQSRAVAELFESFDFSDLSTLQKFELWKKITAKRANSESDLFFIREFLESNWIFERPEELRSILERQQIASSKRRVILTEVLLESEVNELAKKGHLTDRDLVQLTKKIERYCPNASPFRDDYLEKVAWKILPSKRHLSIFIQPLKSFNFLQVDPFAVNILSTMRIFTELMTNRERLNLVKHVQKPMDPIGEVIPRFDELVNMIVDTMNENYRDGNRFREIAEQLDTYIRDATLFQRTVLINALIGARGRGLWHMGDVHREELYELGGMQKGSEKRNYFDSYLASVGSYEHTLTVSYLIANYDEENDSELLDIFELFNAPGIKAAQLSYVLRLFGENSDQLKNAQNKASEPDMHDIYEALDEVRGLGDYKMLELLGSGSIKSVVKVKLDDGRVVAAYIRRKNIIGTNKDTLEMARRWIEHQRSKYGEGQYDFDYLVESVETQLSEEILLTSEAERALKMKTAYKGHSDAGWSFEVPSPLTDLPMTDEIVFYELIPSGAVAFDQLSKEDRSAASRLILETEFSHLLKMADPDRHLGNYMFDPKSKKIYVVDFGQTYDLRRLDVGQRFGVALFLRNLEEGRDPSRAAKGIVDSVSRILQKKSSALRALEYDFENIFRKKLKRSETVLEILQKLSDQKLYLPKEVYVGVIRGLIYLTEEQYAQEVGQGEVHRIQKRSVVSGLVRNGLGFFSRISEEHCARGLIPRVSSEPDAK